ncbi:unnamed protein product [Calypogeia fissa]
MVTTEVPSFHSSLSSPSSLASSHDGSGSHVDGENHGNSTGLQQRHYALAVVEDQTGSSDDAAEKQWMTKWKKHGIGFSVWRKVHGWKLEMFALTVIALLVVFEVRRISLDRSSFANSGSGGRFSQEALKMNDTDERLSKLDNLDMTYRKGVACLDLLPVEELTHFKLPSVSSTSPVEDLQYVEQKSSVNWSVEESSVASAFIGNQTMEERANSFKVQATMKVHCGFCDGDQDFHIDASDKTFLAECKIVVLTCTFGGGDDLYQPIGMTEASLSQVCYVAFWDDVTLELQAAKGQEPDRQTRQVGFWRVVVVKNLPFSDQRRNGKIPKLLNHRFFPQARYSIWVDSKSQFRRDPIGVIETLLVRPKSVFAISEHGGRSCVYKEGEAIVKKNKALPEEVAIQLNQYHKENFPELAQFDDHKALAEASVIVREHTPLTNLFMCNWFNEVMRFTARDQLSFPYVLVKLQVMHPNMFTVCTRRALVNSIGHTGKKPKPLNSKWT